MLLLLEDQHFSSRMEDILFNTIAALAPIPDTTLREIPKLYNDPRFRQSVIARTTDDETRDFWMDFHELSQSEQSLQTRPLAHRIRSFTRSEPMRNITCQTEGFDIGQLINEGADILISTAGPEIHGEANLLIDFLICRIQLAMFARLGTSGPRRPVFLFIDESQHVKGSSLPLLLSEGAKTGICVILLSQYLDQWTEKLRLNALGNVGNIITFQVGPNDSRRLSNVLSPFTSADAENLDKFEALVKMRVDGRTIPTFNINTLPLIGEPDETTYDRVREQSRARFTKPKDQLKSRIPESFAAAFTHEPTDVEED